MLFNSNEPGSESTNGPDLGPDQLSKPTRESWSAWLDRTERETWQMELLVAGFAIVLLAGAWGPLEKRLALLRNNAGEDPFGEILTELVGTGFQIGYALTLATLVLGVLFRSLWIGALGVRSFSGEVDLSGLRLAPRFDRFLRRRLPPFDDYIIQLEGLCSAVFALSFLGFFVVLSIVLFLAVWVGIFMGFLKLSGLEGVSGGTSSLQMASVMVMVPIGIATLIFGAIYAVDFMTGGRLKRSRSFSTVYYPIYRLFGWITLARFYRPLYYNLVDNALGRKLIYGLVPYSIAFITLIGFKAESFTPQLPRFTDYGFGRANAYDEGLETSRGDEPFISGRVASSGTVELFLPIQSDGVEEIYVECEPQLEAYKTLDTDQEGSVASQEIYLAMLECVGSRHRLRIDGKTLDGVDFAFVEHPARIGSFLYTVLSVDSLESGRHLLSVERARPDTGYYHLRSIPFFKP